MPPLAFELMSEPYSREPAVNTPLASESWNRNTLPAP